MSSVWSDDDRLEKLYEGFDNVAFLYQVRGLEFQPTEAKEWFRFWQWLGVATAPRTLVDEKAFHQLSGATWQRLERSHPHAGNALWTEYLSETREKFGSCPRHGPDYRRLSRSVTLDGFAYLVQEEAGRKLEILYQLLAENWPHLRESIPKAEICCYRQDCPQHTRSAEAPSFFEYLARYGKWIAARTDVDGSPRLRLFQPSRCWSVSPTESPAIRNLLPSPIRDPNKGEYALFDQHIGIRSIDRASCEDLFDLLRRLPEEYPDPSIAVYSGRRFVPRALAVLTRWVVERINNSLMTMGAGILAPVLEWPPRWLHSLTTCATSTHRSLSSSRMIGMIGSLASLFALRPCGGKLARGSSLLGS